MSNPKYALYDEAKRIAAMTGAVPPSYRFSTAQALRRWIAENTPKPQIFTPEPIPQLTKKQLYKRAKELARVNQIEPPKYKSSTIASLNKWIADTNAGLNRPSAPILTSDIFLSELNKLLSAAVIQPPPKTDYEEALDRILGREPSKKISDVRPGYTRVGPGAALRVVKKTSDSITIAFDFSGGIQNTGLDELLSSFIPELDKTLYTLYSMIPAQTESNGYHVFPTIPLEGPRHLIRKHINKPYDPYTFNYRVQHIANFYDREILLVKFSLRTSPQDFALADSADLNCVLDCIASATNISRDKIMEIHSSLLGQAQDSPKYIMADKPRMNKDAAVYVAKKLGVRIVFNTTAGEWFDTYSVHKSKKKKIAIFAHDGHASAYYEPDFKIRKVVYYDNHDALAEAYKTLPGIKKMRRNQCQLEGFILEGKFHKVFKPPVGFAEDPNYFTCTSQESFEFKHWKVTNRIFSPPAQYYDAISAAVHWVGSRLVNDSYKPNTKTKYHTYDINGAYYSFYNSPYYSQYKLPIGYYNVFEVDSPGDGYALITKAGWARVTNVRYLNAFYSQERFIQDGCFYTNLELYVAHVNQWADFDITHIIVAGSEHIDYPFRPTKTPDANKNRINKAYNVKFIGRCITGGMAKTKTEHYYTEDILEWRQIQHMLSEKNIPYETETSAITAPIPEDTDDSIHPSDLEELLGSKVYPDPEINPTKPNNRPGYLITAYIDSHEKTNLWNLNSYIYAYAKVTFIEACIAATNAGADIWAYNTDGFITDKYVDLGELVGPKGMQLKYKYETVNWNLNSEIKVHTQFDPANLTHDGISPPPLSVYANMPNGFHFIYGPAGAGKSYNNKKYPLVGSCYGSPTNALKQDYIKDEMVKAKSHTNQALFGLSSSRVKALGYSSVFPDELSMHGREQLNQMVNIAGYYRINLYLTGDIDPNFGCVQLPPVIGKVIEPEYIDWHGITWHQANIDHDRRRQIREDALFLDTLRELGPVEQLNRVIEKFSGVNNRHILSMEEAAQLFDAKSRGIAGTHKRCYEFNNYVYTRDDIDFIHAKTVNSNAKIPKSTIITIDKKGAEDFVWMGRKGCLNQVPVLVKCDFDDDNKPVTSAVFGRFKTEWAYMTTADHMQGGTHDGKIFIDIIGMLFRKNMFYTAITRCKTLDNVYIIMDEDSIDYMERLVYALEKAELYNDERLKLCRGLLPIYRKVFNYANPAEVTEPEPFMNKPGVTMPYIRPVLRANFTGQTNLRSYVDGHNIAFDATTKYGYTDICRALLTAQESFYLNEFPGLTAAQYKYTHKLFLDIDMDCRPYIRDIIKNLMLVAAEPMKMVPKIMINNKSGKLHLVINVAVSYEDRIAIGYALRDALCPFDPAEDLELTRAWYAGFDYKASGIRSLFSINVRDGRVKAADMYIPHNITAEQLAEIMEPGNEEKFIDLVWDYSMYNMEGNMTYFTPEFEEDIRFAQRMLEDEKERSTAKNTELARASRYNPETNEIDELDVDQDLIDSLIAGLDSKRANNKSWYTVLKMVKHAAELVPGFDPTYFLHEWSANSAKYNRVGNERIWASYKVTPELAGGAVTWLIDNKAM